MTWIEKELQIHELAESVEVENRILLRLFEMWKSERGKQKRFELEKCNDRYATEKAIYDYDKSIFIFIWDDAARNSLDVADEKIFSHWLSDDLIATSKIDYLTQCCKDQANQVIEFVEDLRTLQGAKTSKNKSYRYMQSKNPRASILWDCALCVVSREHLYGLGSGTMTSVINDFTNEVSSNIGGSGYSGVDMENVIDAYIAFSIYKGITKIKQSRE